MPAKFEFREVFNKETITYSALQISSVYPSFKTKAFIDTALDGFQILSFGDRHEKITDALVEYLPTDFESSVEILISALGPEIEGEELEGYAGFYTMPFLNYVKRFGLNYLELSQRAMLEMTKRFTAEFAIRTFLHQEERKTLDFLHLCAKDKNCHVRRLASEGSRPRLPLGSRLHAFIKEPRKVLNLLEALKNEPTRLVQRSIANNLNDIGKNNPDVVVEFLARWKEEDIKDIDWIIAHATRSLIKEGHLGTLRLLGFDPDIEIQSSTLTIKNRDLVLGESLEFECRLDFKNNQAQKVVIDYLLYFKKANGQNRPKVFKLSSKNITAKQSLTLKKKHPIKQATTRAYYEGEQFLQLQVNGKRLGAPQSFNLKLS